MTRSEFDAHILSFCGHLFGDLGVPVVKIEVIAMMPLKAHVGVTIPDVPPETVLSVCTPSSINAAGLAAWPVGAFVNCPPKSVGIAADDQHVIFDLVFYHARLEIEEHLKPKA